MPDNQKPTAPPPPERWLGESVGGIGVGIGQQMLEKIQQLGQTAKGAVQSSEAMRQGYGYSPQEVLEASTMAMGGAMPFAQKGAAGIFGGRLGGAGSAGGQMRLDWAKQAAARGDNVDQIWRQTGWFQGKDGQWRFEIDPSQFAMKGAESDGKFKFGKQHLPGHVNTLDELIDHPTLFKSYPQLAKLPVSVQEGLPSYGVYNSRSGFRGGLGSISIRAGMSERKTQDTLIHEIQHAVQEKEQFPSRGTNPYGAINMINNILYDKARRLGPNHPEYGKVYDAWKTLQTMPNLAYEIYQRNPGEIEARYASMRQEWPEAERRAIAPSTALENLTRSGLFQPEFPLPWEK